MRLAAAPVEDSTAPSARSRVRVAVHLAVVACAIAAGISALVSYPSRVGDLGRVASDNSALSFQDRLIAGGNAVVTTRSALHYAQALVPYDGTYRLVVGPNVSVKSPQQVFVDQFFRYYLVPRRPSPTASFVICYGCDQAQLGPGWQPMYDLGNGVVIGRITA